MEGDTLSEAPPIAQETESPKSPPPIANEIEIEIKVNVSPKSERPSPEPNCAICLGKSENKSFTDSCLHQFCFKCLLEWSKVKAECPLCKQHFKSIIHNVRSNEDYDQYHLRPAERPNSYLSNIEYIRRFSYRSTLTPERHREMAFQNSLTPIHLGFNNVIPSHRFPDHGCHRRRHPPTTEYRRREIYQRGLWVDPLADITGRYRESSPEFYRLNPAQMHRLVPWLNRELNVLSSLLHNNSAQVMMLLDLILGYLTRHPITSEQFRGIMSPHLGHYTRHFLHELNAFARSPYDMIGFDESAMYLSYSSSNFSVDIDSDSSSDSDVIILSEPGTSQPPAVPRSTSQPSGRFSQTIVTNGSSITVAEGPSLSPVAGPSGSGNNSIMLMLSDGFRNQTFSDIDSISSGTSMEIMSHLPQPNRLPSDPEDCMIVGYVKPRHERTPEIITLDSEPGGMEEGEVAADNVSVVSSQDLSECLCFSSNPTSSFDSSGSEFVPYERSKNKKSSVRKKTSSSKSQTCSTKHLSTDRKRKSKLWYSTSSESECKRKSVKSRQSRKRKISTSSESSSSEDNKSWSHKRKEKPSRNSRQETWCIKSRVNERKSNKEENNHLLDCAGSSYEPPYTQSEITNFTDKSRPKLRSIVITRSAAPSAAPGKSKERSFSPVASSSRSSTHHHEGSSSRSSSHKLKHKSRKEDEKKRKKERRSSSSSFVATLVSKAKRKKKKSKKLCSSTSSESS